MFRAGDSVFTHANADLVLKPRGGGGQKTFLSAKSFEGDPNVESFFLLGTSHRPIAIGVGVQKPDWKFQADVWEEMVDYAAICGPGYKERHHDGLLTLRQGAKIATVKFEDMVIEKGWGIKSENSGGPGIEVSGKCIDIVMNGIGGFSAQGSGGSKGGSLTLGASISVGGVSLGVNLSF